MFDNIDHPEIEEFITWKSKEEAKVKPCQDGYDTDMDGEAYQTVSGQNSNNSLRLSDEFMEKVSNLDKDPDATIELKDEWTLLLTERLKLRICGINLIRQLGNVLIQHHNSVIPLTHGTHAQMVRMGFIMHLITE